MKKARFITSNKSFEYQHNDDGEIVGMTEYYANGNRQMEWLLGGITENGMGFTREWHPNGQLKFEMGWDENREYHGLMTKWDEEGNILDQENYSHGKKVEV